MPRNGATYIICNFWVGRKIKAIIGSSKKHQSSQIFEKKKRQFGYFSARKIPELPFFLLKVKIGPGFARASLDNQRKSATLGSLTLSKSQVLRFFVDYLG